MKARWIIFLLVLFVGIANAKIIVVNTADNTSPGIGQTNLLQAISNLQDGDTVRFAIPGSGPFYLVTPPLDPENGHPQ